MSADPLAQLKDIHLPPPIEIWPPAPGWFVLAGLGVLFLIYAAFKGWRYYQNTRPKREALSLLTQYKEMFLQTGQYETTCAQINTLLKRVALAFYPREEVAENHGAAWIAFLNRSSNQLDFQSFQLELTHHPYQKSMLICPMTQRQQKIEPLIRLARQWISQQRGTPCSN